MSIGNLHVGAPKQITSSGNVKNTSGALLGIFCSSSTSGTVTLYDDAGTGTAAKIVDTFSVAANTWYPMPLTFANGLNAVIGGTASVTVIYA